MPLFLITGTPATGKSQVCRTLKERGYDAYDIDDGLARWQHNTTGYIHPKSSVKPAQRTPEFLAEHSWNVSREYIEDIYNRSADKPVFICGCMANEQELRDLFKDVFALYVDDDTLLHRLTTRTSNTDDWGKQPHELEETLQRHHRLYKAYKQAGDSIIDATKPLEQVVGEVLAKAGVYAKLES